MNCVPTDIDECTTAGMCQNGECDNTLGSYKCRCEEGYSVKSDEEPGCTDDDECLLGTFNCDANADCVNTQGGYECRCREGFTGNGVLCRDVNECLTNNGGCDQDAQAQPIRSLLTQSSLIQSSSTQSQLIQSSLI